MTFSKVDYLKLLIELEKEQYGLNDKDDDLLVEMSPPPSPPIEDIPVPRRYGKHEVFKITSIDSQCNLTDTPKNKILEAVCKNRTILVGDYSIRVTMYNGQHPKFNHEYVIQGLTLDFNLYHKTYKTISGAPCIMDVAFNITKDSRFVGRPWLSYFKESHGRRIPVETVVEIVKWLQVSEKLTAFL